MLVLPSSAKLISVYLIVELQRLFFGGIEEVRFQEIEEHAGIDYDIPLLMFETDILISFGSEQILDFALVLLVFR